jgi:hypothetical protein
VVLGLRLPTTADVPKVARLSQHGGFEGKCEPAKALIATSKGGVAPDWPTPLLLRMLHTLMSLAIQSNDMTSNDWNGARQIQQIAATINPTNCCNYTAVRNL